MAGPGGRRARGKPLVSAGQTWHRGPALSRVDQGCRPAARGNLLMKKATTGLETLDPGVPRPNFFLAGVAKAGTTSLYEYLRQHPQIFMPEIKEPSYFVQGYGVKTWDDYLALFKDAGDKAAIGDASAIYTSTEGSLAWIKSALGEVKLVVILRNPASRAFSQYGWMAREGYEDAPTFAEALRREPLRLRDPAFREQCPQFFGDYLYFTTGLYADQVETCFDTFGRERVKIYLFEEFIREPRNVCRDVFQFLGVDDQFVPKMEVHNEGRMPKSVAWQYWLRAEQRRRRVLGSRAFRRKLADRLMGWNVQLGEKAQPDPVLLRDLTERYRPDISRLQTLLGRDLSPWLKSKG